MYIYIYIYIYTYVCMCKYVYIYTYICKATLQKALTCRTSRRAFMPDSVSN